MLVISRQRGEWLAADVNGVRVKVVVIEIRPGAVRLGIELPREHVCHRGEIWEQIEANTIQSAPDRADAPRPGG